MKRKRCLSIEISTWQDFRAASYDFSSVVQIIQSKFRKAKHIFRILKHFATTLCTFANFKMLLLVVQIDVVLLA